MPKTVGFDDVQETAPFDQTAESEAGEELRQVAARKRFGAELADELDRRAYRKKAQKLRQCASWMVLRKWTEAGHLQVRSANFCHQHKLCGACARYRAMKLCQTYYEKSMQLCADYDLVPFLVTLTQRPAEDLTEGFRRFRASLRALNRSMRDSRSSKGRSSAWGDSFPAIVWQIEIKRGAGSGQWHVHAHALGLRPKVCRLDYQALTEEWFRLSGNGNTVLPDFRPMRSSQQMFRGRSLDAVADQFRHDVMEVIKYPTKLDELEPSDLVEIDCRTKGARFLLPWGLFHGCEPDSSLTCREEYWGPWIEFFARHDAKYGGYKRYVRAWSEDYGTAAEPSPASSPRPKYEPDLESLPF